MDNQLQLPEYTQEDYISSTRPYETIVAIKDPFEQEAALNQLALAAAAVGFRGVKQMYKKYCDKLRKEQTGVVSSNITSFAHQPLELTSGDWDCSEGGISRTGAFGAIETACVHPIMPVERYVNVDTGVKKLRIWWRNGKQTRSMIFDCRTLATASSIVALSDHGVAVNSENAKLLVRWLHDAEYLNYEQIPEKQSVGRLGWIETGEDEPLVFSPYAGSLEFDGDENFRSFFNAVKPSGTYKEWMAMAKEIRKNGITARVVLAASFASALVKPLGALPFFVHLWGSMSGSGKTVALMLAASVWANPEMGRYVHTFNSTSVGQETSAGFVNSMPLILDELQVIRNKQDFDETIYKLAEGVGRMRGSKTGGMVKTGTWANCILTSGEMPLTTGQSGAGAINRVLNIECREELFPASEAAPNLSARFIAAFVRKHHGHAGKRFVGALIKDGFDKAISLYNKFTRELAKNDTTEKQAMAAAIILTADALANEYLYNDMQSLTVSDMLEFLATKAAVDVGERGYQYMCEWAALNAHKLTKRSVDGRECIGDVRDGVAYIIKSRFEAACTDGGFNYTALMSWCKRKGRIRTSGRDLTMPWWVNDQQPRCVALILPEEGGGFTENPADKSGDLPF